jgi:hypothetical protein
MNGLKRKRIVWTIVFLGLTLAAIVMEVVAGVWHPAGTIPWTEYIAEHVPWPVQLAAYVALAVWLPFHFWRANDKAKAAYKQGYRAARIDAITERQARLGPAGDSRVCGHGFVFGSPVHVCADLPSDAR